MNTNTTNDTYKLFFPLENNFLDISTYRLNKEYSEIVRTKESTILIILTSGTKTLKFGHKSLEFDKSKCLILPPFIKLKTFVNETADFTLIKFNNRILKTLLSKFPLSTSLKTSNVSNYLFLENFDSTIYDSYIKTKTSFMDSNNVDTDTNLYSLEFIGKLLEIQSVRDLLNHHFEPQIEASLNVMREHIYSNISINEIAEKVGLSASTFALKFKDIMGFSPSEYFRILKITDACTLLKFKSVHDVAKDLGYTTSYFIKLFKEIYKQTPKQYLLSLSN